MAHFITEDCIGCTLCKRNCPVKAISGEVKQRHVINSARCVDCGVCGRVCAKGAIKDQNGETVAKLAKEEWLKPVMDTDACSACAFCVEICGKDCLKISLPQFKGDLKVFAYLDNTTGCVGCGMCAGACPLHAITMRKAVRS